MAAKHVQTNNSGNEVYAKDCKIFMEDHKNNEEILNELKVTSVLDKITS
jgi:hypothetical protein